VPLYLVASMAQMIVPSKASTIIVIRLRAAIGFEVLLIRRPQEMSFLGGYLVFPGGAVEKQDCSEKMFSRCRGLSPAEALSILGDVISPEMSLGHWVAAARELFEESGIHFFVNQDGEPSDGKANDTITRLAEKRKALSEGRIDLLHLLESEQLFVDLSRMSYLFHRITPEKYPVRFDTRFYLAALPENQIPLTCSEGGGGKSLDYQTLPIFPCCRRRSWHWRPSRSMNLGNS
jgi:8-oxo-dGTP pyrophosphatase MutT (NUDIX family)